MRIAIPVWNDRISPVFDVARTICVTDVNCASGEVTEFERHVVTTVRPATVLAELGVKALICSAISAPLETMLSVSGIEVISGICGSPDEIIAALAAGDVDLRHFRSPGSKREPEWSPVARVSLKSRGPRS